MRAHELQPPGNAETASRLRRPVAPMPFAPPGRGMSPESVVALQRSIGNRATTRRLQRMIVAIDGDSDAEAAQNATRACLWNLRHRKGGGESAAGDARGAVAGPAKRGSLNYHMRPLLKSDGESIYVLAHGSRYSAEIAGMSPKQIATWLRARFSSRDVWGLGWLGVTKWLDTPFTGAIKLVACHSAAQERHRVGTDEEEDVYPFDRSYAEALARELAPLSATDPFRPTSVQGINGIGWVDEISGRITAIDKGAYDVAKENFRDDSDVGGTGGGKEVNPFTSVGDHAARGVAIRAIFGDPVEAQVSPAGALRAGKGEWGKRRFAVGTGAEI
jgi:hypothetical protein